MYGRYSLRRSASSLSARRAWIEIAWSASRLAGMSVALRKESVDRNYHVCQSPSSGRLSLSARRAWIEIGKSTTLTRIAWVALRKESVDRNDVERLPEPSTPWSLSARRAWIEIS